MLVLGLLCCVFYTGKASAAGNDLIIINKKVNQLAFFSDGKLVRTFPVATGRTHSLTPEGSFKIVVKIKNRPYYKEKIPGGDPRNPLGDRWMGLEVNGTYGTTYAIHGNSNENSIGKYVSSGCIRMHNEDIHWLFPKVEKNTRVVITTSSSGMEKIAAKHGYTLGRSLFAGTLIFNDVSTKLNQPLVLENSRVYLPLRELIKLLGGEVKWNNQEEILTLTRGGRTISYKPLTNKATVNGKEIAILPSLNQNNSVMIPLKNIPEMFGLQVKWNSELKTVSISE
ncbi:L,D-transpeptidase family protein [Paenibacillus wynnii]|uniref:L,D-transpeptidase family protein n=1 Tax=Paenibacillus wynnii TaxID=268407 RepID=UPI001F0B4561|nr:L,D-transpeptidase family protein [Paenibacillus wynnii]